MYFERGYVLEPDAVGQKPFYLLKKALEESDRVAIAKVSLRQKEHLCCLRPYDRAIAMETMFYPDEIRSTAELDLPEDEVTISKDEMAMANTLIDQLAGTFEPEQYEDEYRATLERVIEAKLGAAEPVTAAPAPARGQVVDLMEALKASIQATKKKSRRKQPAAAAPKKQRKKAAVG